MKIIRAHQFLEGEIPIDIKCIIQRLKYGASESMYSELGTCTNVVNGINGK
jgi:hypothetical protein